MILLTESQPRDSKKLDLHIKKKSAYSLQETAYIYPYNGLVRRPNIRCTGSKFVHAYWQVVSHYIPAVLADGVSMLIGAKPRFVDLYR